MTWPLRLFAMLPVAASLVGCGRLGFEGCSIVPSNVDHAVPIDAGTAVLLVGSDADRYWLLNTDDGTITAYDDPDPAIGTARVVRPAGTGNTDGILFEKLAQPGGLRPLGMFAVAHLDVAPGARLTAVGFDPLVVLVAGDVHIAGTVSVAANAIPGMPGPGPGGDLGAGGFGPGEGPGGGLAGITDTSRGQSGGGGGSFGSTGGRGGAGGNGVVDPAAASATYGTAELVPLIGGSGGGSGALRFGVAGLGGHGGGALQLSAGVQIDVAVSGVVDASGGGAYGNVGCGGGGGGGSGGAILLEAPRVNIDGFLGANGGGGAMGGTCDATTTVSDDGAQGSATRVPAPRTGASANGGAGGPGSDADGAAGDGLVNLDGGGGGGGAGRIRINARDTADQRDRGITPTLASTLATVASVGCR